MANMIRMLVKNPKAATRWFGRSKVGTEVMVPENAVTDLIAWGVAVLAPEPEPEPEPIAEPEPVVVEPENIVEKEPKNYSDDPETGHEIVSQSSSQSGEDEPLS